MNKAKREIEGFSGMGFLDEELRVASILLELRNRAGTYCGSSLLPPSWGCKRRRSVEDATPSPQRRLTTSPPPPSFPPPPPRVSVSSVAMWAAGPTERIAAEKEAASSPATPFSFAPSDSSDEKPKCKREKRKASKQKLEEELENLTKCNVIYSTKKKEMETVLEQLRTEKLLLTVRKIELSRVGNLVLDASKSSRQLDTVKTLHNVDSRADHLKPGIVDYHPPLIGDHRRAIETGMMRGVPCPCPRYPITTSKSRQIGGMVTVIRESVVGQPPIGPDLNVCPPPADPSAPYRVEPTSHRSLIRARAAEARRRRMLIWRGSSSK